MRKYIALAAFAVSFALVPANAQNLNPTVEVSNAYEGKMVEATKPAQKMAVPDSLLKFDLDFDYSVLSSPYKGGYDFSPYLLEMRPSADANRANKFYLRLGAGYTLNPEFDLVWSPKFKNEALKMNIYAKNRSYIGKYKSIQPSVQEDGSYSFSPVDGSYSGFDILSIAGANGRYDFARSFVDFGLEYEGINTEFSQYLTNYNAIEAKAGIHSNDNRSSYFKYDAELAYRYSQDDEKVLSHWGVLRSNDIDIKGEVGQVFDEQHAVLVGLGMGLSTYCAYERMSVYMNAHSGNLYIAPHYVYSSYNMSLSAGVRLDMAIASDEAFVGLAAVNNNKGQLIYPDVKFDYQLIRERLDAYASLTGGIDRNLLTSFKEDNHFYTAYPGAYCSQPFSMNSIERFNLRLGVRGNLASVFRYDLSGGFASVGKYRHDAIAYGAELDSFYPEQYFYAPFYAYDDANLAYAELKMALDLEKVLVDGSLTYTHTNLFKKEIVGFSPSPLTGNISAVYKWKDRISAGIHADAAIKRTGYWGENVTATIPGFVNLGLDASFAVNRKLSVWLKGDNLLCQTIQRTPLYAEKGIKFTAGICLNL